MKARKSLHRGFRRLLAIAICLLPMLTGAIWQAAMVGIEGNNPPAAGGYIHTDAYDMHYVSEGSGDVAVVFIAGSGTPSAYTDFYCLQKRLGDKVQAISFDHAGSGWSSTADKPRTVENLGNELKALTDNAAPGKPLVFVCHSLASLEAVYFAQHNPEKMAGIVFLDSGDPVFYRADSEMAAKILNRILSFARTIGLNRALCSLGIPIPFYGESERLNSLPPDIACIDRAMFNKYAGSKATLQVIEEMNENAEKVINGPRLGKLPVLVLSSDSGEEWDVVQSTLASMSESSKQVTLVNASHYLHWSNADEVANEISRFIDSIGD